jgi:hypothetical protein
MVDCLCDPRRSAKCVYSPSNLQHLGTRVQHIRTKSPEARWCFMEDAFPRPQRCRPLLPLFLQPISNPMGRFDQIKGIVDLFEFFAQTFDVTIN